jgi:hypothetical protein
VSYWDHGPGALLGQLRDSAGVKRLAMAAGEAGHADPRRADRREYGRKRLNVDVWVIKPDDLIVAAPSDPSSEAQARAGDEQRRGHSERRHELERGPSIIANATSPRSCGASLQIPKAR